MLSFFRIIKFAFQHFWRNFWLSVITVSMLVLTIVTIDVLIIFNQVTDTAVQTIEEKIDVSIYFYEETEVTTVENAAIYLRGLEQVRDVEVVTADEALERFKVRHADDQTILDSLGEVGENPFGYTLVVKAYGADDFEFIMQAVENPQFSQHIREKDFSDYETIIQRLKDTTSRLEMFGIILSSIFLLISILIIFNTVRIAFFVYREEIGIMKLVGATDAFVRSPFFVEGLIFSFLATVIASAIIFPFITFFEPRFDSYFVDTQTNLVSFFVDNAVLILGSQFLILSVISLVSIGFAMRKYLRV